MYPEVILPYAIYWAPLCFKVVFQGWVKCGVFQHELLLLDYWGDP